MVPGMVTRLRHTLIAMVLGLTLGSLAGCDLLQSKDRAPYSDRTAGAYPQSNTEQAEELARRLEEQIKRLKQLSQPQTQPAPQPVKMAPVPLLPLAGMAPTRNPGTDYPFGSDSQRRTVDIPPMAPIALPAPAPAVRPAAPIAATQPAGADTHAKASPSGQASLEDVISNLASMAENQPEDLQLQLQLRMMYLATRQDDKALEPIPSISPEQNIVVGSILQSMIAVRDGTQGDMAPADAAIALIALQNLRERLMAQADLQIPVIKLCKAVDGFGVYKPFDGNEFPTGQSQPVIVYCEVENYSASQDESGMYHTRLDMSLSLYDSRNQLAMPTQADKNIEDVSANRRHDFFLTRVIILPESLSPGPYTLKVTLTDTTANKAVTASVPVRMRPPGPRTPPTTQPTTMASLPVPPMALPSAIVPPAPPAIVPPTPPRAPTPPPAPSSRILPPATRPASQPGLTTRPAYRESMNSSRSPI